jgi:hypothetical protein
LLNPFPIWKVPVIHTDVAQGEAKIFDEARGVSLANRDWWRRVFHGDARLTVEVQRLGRLE